MSSRIRLVYLTVALACAGRLAGAQGQDNADAAYADRANLASAQRAAALWQAALVTNPNDYEVAWKLARVRHWLGDHARDGSRAPQYEQGAAAARKAVALRPGRPEGHFWLGANLGGLAEAGSVMAGLKYRTPIREEFEAVLRIDRTFDQGAALCGLSNYYLKVPSLFGGSKSKSETLARECVAIDPNSTIAHYFLAETLAALDRRDEARAELRKVLEVPLDPKYIPEGREWKQKAEAMLKKLQ